MDSKKEIWGLQNAGIQVHLLSCLNKEFTRVKPPKTMNTSFLV
ncbi:hypothetical protein NC99_03090 [Sunxiuqinia dokdonensis]|uniref:Uncharacterized protein n=1 Tax=Sunxiuqinia dokdonensis TaxID=1409788 RepID=A0A0L8VEM4_9BACT|nr:hypothetical protein NC99_03090 [Sunxiuqinia dokdonensis]